MNTTSRKPLYLKTTFRLFILRNSYSVSIAEKNKGSLDMVYTRFGDRNFYISGCCLGGPKIFCSKYSQNIYQIAGNLMLSTNMTIKN